MQLPVKGKTAWLHAAIFVLICVAAAVAPLLPIGNGNSSSDLKREVVWPEEFEGRLLQPMELSIREQRYLQSFPGQVARFTDGTREVIMRWIVQPSRQVHSSTECFSGTGYKITPLPIYADAIGRYWLQFKAASGEQQLRVRELIFDETGRSWPDVSSWYWAVMPAKQPGPWWAVTVAEPMS